MRVSEYKKTYARKKRANPEHTSQVALIRLCNMSMDKYPDFDMLFAIPNGGMRNVITATRLKAEGVRAGVPDLYLAVARGPFYGFFVEMKAGKNKISPSQKTWHANLVKQGYKVAVYYDAKTAFDLMCVYLDS